MNKWIYFGALGALLYSLESDITPKKEVLPCLKEFSRISRENYVLDHNDCSNKVGEYVRYVRATGRYADAVTYKTPETTINNKSHAVARIIMRGKYFYVDLASKRCFWQIPSDWVLDEVVKDTDLYRDDEWTKNKTFTLNPELSSPTKSHVQNGHTQPSFGK